MVLHWTPLFLIGCLMLRTVSRLALLAALAHCSTGFAQDREWLPYKKLLEVTYMDKFYDAPLSQRDKIKLRGYLMPNNKAIKPQDVVLTVAHADGKERIQINTDGMFELVPTAKALKENPMVFTNVPAGEKAGVSFAVLAVVPEGLKFNYTGLTAGVKQATDLIKARAGMLSMFAPKFNGVEITFAKPAKQTLQIVAKAGTQTLTADAKGVIKLKVDAALVSEDPQVVFSEGPLEVGLATDL